MGQSARGLRTHGTICRRTGGPWVSLQGNWEPMGQSTRGLGAHGSVCTGSVGPRDSLQRDCGPKGQSAGGLGTHRTVFTGTAGPQDSLQGVCRPLGQFAGGLEAHGTVCTHYVQQLCSQLPNSDFGNNQDVPWTVMNKLHTVHTRNENYSATNKSKCCVGGSECSREASALHMAD